METREELLNSLGEALSIIRQLSSIQQRLNQVRSQYKNIVPHKEMSKRVKKYWAIVIVIGILSFMMEMGTFAGIVYAVINIALIKLYYVFKNKKIDTNNELARVNNENVKPQEQAVLNELQQVQIAYRERVGYWYPDNYCSVEAVEFFYNSVMNYRADNLKEAINLYETFLHQRRVEDNQKKAIEQQKLNNLLSAGSLMMQGLALGEQSRHNATAEFEMQKTNRALNDIRSRL